MEFGGWGAIVAEWYARSADVMNRGFSGEIMSALHECKALTLH